MRNSLDTAVKGGKTPVELLGGAKQKVIQFLEDFVFDCRNRQIEIKAGTILTLWNSVNEEAPVVSFIDAVDGTVFLSKELKIPARVFPSELDETIEAIQGIADLSRLDLRFMLELIYGGDQSFTGKKLRDSMDEKVNLFARDGDEKAREDYLRMRGLRSRATELFDLKLAGNTVGVHREIPLGKSQIKLDIFTDSPEGSWVLYLNRFLSGGHISHDNQISWMKPPGKELVLMGEGRLPDHKFEAYLKEFKQPTPYHLLCAVLEKI